MENFWDGFEKQASGISGEEALAGTTGAAVGAGLLGLATRGKVKGLRKALKGAEANAKSERALRKMGRRGARNRRKNKNVIHL